MSWPFIGKKLKFSFHISKHQTRVNTVIHTNLTPTVVIAVATVISYSRDSHILIVRRSRVSLEVAHQRRH